MTDWTSQEGRTARAGKLRTRAEAILEFKADVLPGVRAEYEKDGQVDAPARREAWNNWTDALCKEGRITRQQYETWEGPFG